MTPVIKITNATRIISMFFLVTFLGEILAPTVAFALTGGPSQPEVQSFEPVGTTQMVDPFSGDFVYNIPLMDVDGYPLNISYHSGVSMDQEASWVGLGWNLNVGTINRGMRGLPDDFKGSEDKVEKGLNINKNWTFGLNANLGNLEIVGFPAILNLGLGAGIFYNNYKGIGTEHSINAGVSIGKSLSLTPSIGINQNSQEGLSVSPSVGLNASVNMNEKHDAGGGISIGGTFNSRSGIKALTISSSPSLSAASGAARSARAAAKYDNKPSESFKGPGFSASIPIGSQSYVPQVSAPMRNLAIAGSFGIGFELYWVSGMFKGGFHYSQQKLAEKNSTHPAYGYMYAEEGKDDAMALNDFNREKDGEYTNNTPALPLTNFTYDIYSVSGQGVGGMYRPYRNDKGIVSDPHVTTTSTGGNGGVDLDFGNIFKGGLEGGGNFSQSSSGKWKGDGNEAQSILGFQGKSEDNPAIESYYFKAAGEMTTIDQKYFNEMGGDDPVSIEVTKSGKANGQYNEKELEITNNQRKKREKRNQAIGVLNAEEAKYAALDKKIKSYIIEANGDQIVEGGGNDPGEERVTDERKKNHISEITTYRTDGARYVYGIPAYNNSQKEETFNVKKPSEIDCANGLVPYEPAGANPDNSTKNKQGFDNYFSSTELPAYAHSYLLTAVLSADYVDRTGNGPSDDDFGTYTKFNYKKHSSKYNWRVPYDQDKATFNEGLKSQTKDDKGSYIYGEKEIWYLQSVITKSMVAEFSLSPRADGRGVKNNNGGLETSSANTQQSLDKITLYSKCDREDNKENAVPLQVVHFVYDYTLCQGVPNFKKDQGDERAGTGKLTLKQIYFTYQKSLKGKLSPYKFTYSNHNPAYSLTAYDRWGNYKLNDCNHPNSDFPYVDQGNREDADKYASSWSLTDIMLPSGGNIKIDYEADDYAFVQNKRAMQMMQVVGLGNDDDLDPDNELNSNKLYRSIEVGSNRVYFSNNILKVKLPVPVLDNDEFREKYLSDPDDDGEMSKIYFKFLVDVIGRQGGIIPSKDENEFVTGYAELTGKSDVFGVKDPITHKYSEAYIELKNVNVDALNLVHPLKNASDEIRRDANPIARTAWQMARIYLSGKVYAGSEVDGEGNLIDLVTQLFKTMLGSLTDLKSSAEGINNKLRDWGFGQVVDLDKSMVRLYSPEYKKIGGGTRVKKLVVNDKWSEMSEGTQDASYGQEYDYTKMLDGKSGQIISSGVAEYEPMIGNEENPLHQPVAITVENYMAPDDRYYQETPYGESFYPNPSVGYSQVKVHSIKSDNIKRTATGYVQQEFFTARDFPVISEQTTVQRKPDRPSFISRIFKFDVEDLVTVSQGHAIKLNNMHGKEKASWVFAEGQDKPISGQEYFYKTDKLDNHKLSNKVTTINKNGEIQTNVVGKEADFIADMRQSTSEAWVGSFEIDVDVAILPFPPIPFPIPSVIPDYSHTTTDFKSAVVTKVITSYGVLEKVVMHDLGSTVSTENMAYDAETGEVLLTKVNNNFDDPIYSFNYPAHWAYDRMGMAYKNLGIQVEIEGVEDGVVDLKHSKHSKYFVVGDEVINSKDHNRYWVNSVEVGSINLISRLNSDDDKVNISGESLLTIVKSGRKNMQSTPVGSIALLDNPIVEVDGQKQLAFTRILNANATEFSDTWTDYCECGINNGTWEDDHSGDPPDYALNNQGQVFVPNGNLYNQGAAGIWKAKRSNVFLTEREHSDLNRNSNIRKDGTFKNFSPFWNPHGGNDWTKVKSNWAWTAEVTKMSPYGFELENRDTLNHFSSAVYGYSNTLPIAVAQNSRYKEVGVDNFEDYNCTNCGTTKENPDHWSFKNHSDQIVSTVAHTGKNSIQVKKHSSISVGKKIECKDKPINPPG